MLSKFKQDWKRAHTKRPHFISRSLRNLQTTIANDDACAFSRKTLCHSQPNASSSACHQGDLVFEAFIHRPYSPPSLRHLV
jgi:hypothetical protein